MKRIRLWPAPLLALAAFAAPAPAQYVPPGVPADQPYEVKFVGQQLKPAPAPTADMQEQIEIMRRLLSGALADFYGVKGAKAVSPPEFAEPVPFDYGFPIQPGAKNTYTTAHAARPAPNIEGVYLQDYGVVYAVTLPPTGFDVLPGSKPDSGSKAPPDDWDRIRKEIHGETPAPPSKPVPGHTPLSEVILKVLADNGKHFDALADGERVSVAVTFRGAANCTNCHQNPWNSGQPDPALLNNQWQDWPTYPYGTAAGGGPAPGGTAATGPMPAAPGQPLTSERPELVDARNAMLLGDLHMKQGRTKEALEAYQKAADTLRPWISHAQISEPGLRPKDVPALLMLVELGNKVAAVLRSRGTRRPPPRPSRRRPTTRRRPKR